MSRATGNQRRAEGGDGEPNDGGLGVVRSLGAGDESAYIAIRREMLADSPWAFAASAEDDRGLQAGFLERIAREGTNVIMGEFARSLEGEINLVGVAGVHTLSHRKMAHRAHVWGVYVSPKARGHGVGERVMRGVIDAARRWPSVTSLGLSASVKSLGAIRLYERLGFVRWGVEPGAVVLNGEAIDEVHLVKMLD
ncbi:MAG: N-acetyltransferase family protein [Phycisphaerales bacterium]